MAPAVEMLHTCLPPYLLIRGCCSDSKTRLQLSRHLFAPRISTTISEEEKTDVVSAVTLKPEILRRLSHDIYYLYPNWELLANF